MLNKNRYCEISGSYGSEYKDSYLSSGMLHYVVF
jgi:hypothetical protein